MFSPTTKPVRITKKTNKKWYPYEQQGSCYRLVEDELMFCPMLRDGSEASEAEESEVEWLNIDEELANSLYKISDELLFKE